MNGQDKSKISNRYLEVLQNCNTYQAVDMFIDSLKNLLGIILGASNIVLTNSGTSALITTLHSLGISKGDFVVCPVNVCPAVINSIAFLKANPVLIDVNDDMNIDLNIIEQSAHRSIKCMIYVLRYGSAGYFMRAYEIAKRKNMSFIIDAAQAFAGSVYPFNSLEIYADAVIYSFSDGKHIPAGGGGAIITKHSELAIECEKFVNYGAIKIPFYESIGLNLKCSPVQALLIENLIEFKIHDFERRMELSDAIISTLSEYGFSPIAYSNQNNMNALYRLVLSIPAWAGNINDFVGSVNHKSVLIRQAFPFLLNEYCNRMNIKFTELNDIGGFRNAERLKKSTISIYVDSRMNALNINMIKKEISNLHEA